MIVETIVKWLSARGWSAELALLSARFLSFFALILCAWVINFCTRHVILRVVTKIVKRTPFAWDDVFLRHGVFTRLSHLAPVLILTGVGPELFLSKETWIRRMEIGMSIYLVVIALMVVSALLDSAAELIELKSRGVPLKGFTQGAKLILILTACVFVLSLVLNQSPLVFLSGLGALTAVLLLIFKDAILGLVAGVQISVNRMIQIGDWIEMPKYGADGDVLDVSLTTVKVQNWDKTISLIPSYALISDPVKNWRSMFEAGGRRIKRSIFLDMRTFRFVDEALLARMMKFEKIRPHLEKKLPEIRQWNEKEHQDLSVLVNGRRLTNVGCYRAYVEAYLRSQDQIHQDMTFLVRQLQPTDKGLPLEVYVFTKDTRWLEYERIQSDIFDHLLTVISEFDLSVYQSPSGNDIHGALTASQVRDNRQREDADVQTSDEASSQ